MKATRLSVFFAGLIYLTACSFTGCQTPTPTPPQGIPAFRWIDKDWGICAGGQPDSQGWIWLSVQPAGQNGQGVGRIDTTIKLNYDSEASDNNAVTAFGFSLQYDPIPQDWKTNVAQAAVLDRFIRETLHLMKPGIYVHDGDGKDTVGAFIFAYRRNCGWTDADARREMETNGWSKLPGLQYFVDNWKPDLGSTNTSKAWRR